LTALPKQSEKRRKTSLYTRRGRILQNNKITKAQVLVLKTWKTVKKNVSHHIFLKRTSTILLDFRTYKGLSQYGGQAKLAEILRVSPFNEELST
jgi:hypothetical protein